MGELANISEIVDRMAGLDPGGLCIVAPSGSLTYREMAEMVEAAARGLRDLGVGSGDRVLTEMPNRPSSLALWLGMARVEAALVPFSPVSTEDEVGRLAGQAHASLAVTTEERQIGDLKSTTAESILAKGSNDATPIPAAQTPGAPVVMIPTSGTTSAPKLVIQSHRSFLLAAEAFPGWMGLTRDDRMLTALPLFHLNAMVYSALSAMWAGASLILLERFSARGLWSEAKRYEATEFNAIGAMIEILARQPPSASDRDHRVRLAYSAPALSEERHRAIEERFGFQTIIDYGMSETPFGTIWPLEGPRPYGTMGHLRQHPRLGNINSAQVVGPDGSPVPVGTEGELLLRNPALMSGYFGQPEVTEAALHDGWLHTGDLVRLDEAGNYTHVGRIKEMICRRGENLAPAEIESVLADHPDVTGAAVLGVPADLGEEDVVAFYTTDRGDGLDGDELRDWCSSRLSRHKVPEQFIIVPSFPMTATGRVAKHPLRDHLANGGPQRKGAAK
jgi:carnitine-CoA ligase